VSEMMVRWLVGVGVTGVVLRWLVVRVCVCVTGWVLVSCVCVCVCV
jgi:hypothetical protein